MQLVEMKPETRNAIPVSEAARRLHCCMATVKTMVRRGELDGFKMPNGRWRVYADTVDRILCGGAEK